MLKVSNLIGFGGGGTPPSITSSASTSVQENLPLLFTITTDAVATITIGGADAARFELVSNTLSTSHSLRWASNGTKDYESPNDANTDNVYSITLTPTDGSGNVGSSQSFAASVTNLVAEDPNWTSVKLLLGFEGANGSTGAPGMTDESPAAHGTATVSGGAIISTSQFKFGSSSLSLTGSDAISFPDSNDFNLSSSPFTIEMFLRPTSVSGTQFLIGQWDSPGNLGWILYLNGAALALNVSTTGSDNNLVASGGTLITGSQQFVAIDFDGTKYRLYVGTTMVASSVTLRTFFDSSNLLTIGANAGLSAFFYSGSVDELRLTKGVARYASDGGLTVPVAAFPRG